MSTTPLILRDIHRPDAPPWWPPAPGWWILAGALVVVVALVAWWRRRRLRREREIVALFDGALSTTTSAPARVAAMSELLRRAARRRDASADRLEGEAWLHFLDADDASAGFSRGPGRLLLDGGFRPDLPNDAVAALEPLARARFLEWMRR